MIFLLSVIAIFVAVSIYFFFKAENLHRSVIAARKETSIVKQESKALNDNMAVVAKRNEEFAQQRLRLFSNDENCEITKHLTPLVNNYSIIFTSTAKGKGQLHKIAKKCLDNYDAEAYKELKAFIAKQDGQIKRMWSSNNLSGFMALIEGLLLLLQKRQPQKASAQLKQVNGESL